ncbi:TIGR03000 domain-containing protein [Zavarzinella formosa]|uniref:TIGR03000 domain-containing protein n=1 Tax=Zavarzinella formosa TaxID=360055 RepID=UPI00049653CC|nr:TIGR03000 domain-containing protein [Zavarzinella formosa]
MYSVVMLAAMTAAPATPECCWTFPKCFGGCYSSCRPACYPVCPPPTCCYSSCYSKRCGFGGCTSGGCGYSSCGYSSCGASPCGYVPVSQPPYEELTAVQAQIKIQVPEGAKVYTDGYLNNQTGSTRILTTPEITPGTDYNYTLKVEFTVNGETRVASKQVVVRGGSVTPVDFTGLAANKSSSAVSVNLPAGSKLMVDGVETTRQNFNTPDLSAGSSVTHTFVTETPRDGRTEVETRKVTFKVGEPVVIDFSRKSADSVVSVK